MPWHIVFITLIVLAVVATPLIVLYARRRWLTGQGGLFDCAYRLRDASAGDGWALGMARYRGESLEWFRAFSLSLKPRRVLDRVSTGYVQQRSPEGIEAIALFEDSVIVTLQDHVTHAIHSLSMARPAALALMSWLESAPPGSRYRLPGSADSPPSAP